LTPAAAGTAQIAASRRITRPMSWMMLGLSDARQVRHRPMDRGCGIAVTG